MVNADRVKRKLPSLLVDDSIANNKSWNSLTRGRYRLVQFNKCQPEKFDCLINRVFADLAELEKALTSQNTVVGAIKT